MFVCSAWEHCKSRKTYMIGSLYIKVFMPHRVTQFAQTCKPGLEEMQGKTPLSLSFLFLLLIPLSSFSLPSISPYLVVKRTGLLPQLIGKDSGSNQVVLPWCHKNLVEKEQNLPINGEGN